MYVPATRSVSRSAICAIFAIPEHLPAVPKEPVTVRVKEPGQRTGQLRTQVGGYLGVIHAEKLEQTGALSHLFKVTSG
jgi:hypothetical protein